MTTTSGHTPLTDLRPDGGGNGENGGGAASVVQIPEHLRLAAAARLLPEQAGDPTVAAERFLESAAAIGIDLDLMWGTMLAGSSQVRQVCLAVMGSGRTAMLFVSGAERKARSWTAAARLRPAPAIGLPEAAHRERITLIDHACAQVARPDGLNATLAQTLLEPREKEAALAFRGAGFTPLGELVYMRRPLSARAPISAPEEPDALWPDGLALRSMENLAHSGVPAERADELLRATLEESYVETLDCPELCGLRSVADVLDSHKAVGVYDPSLWWLLFAGEKPVGCLLLTVCPEHDSVELVYLGLSPSARGKGLGARLMTMGIARILDRHLNPDSACGGPWVRGTGGLTCAVDTRNAPAMRLYKRLGFARFGQRLPFVRGLHAGAADQPQ